MRTAATVLAFGGTDSSGGSGLSADLRAVSACGVHLLPVVTAVTAQGAAGVSRLVPLEPGDILAQAEAAFSLDDRPPGAVKCGMLGTAAAADCIADFIRKRRLEKLVLDPVLAASSGGRLTDEAGAEVLRERLMPLAALVTPNIPEAEKLLGRRIENEGEMVRAAAELAVCGAAILLKGGHLPGEDVVDIFHDGRSPRRFPRRRLPGSPRGTGCTFASLAAACLALGLPVPEAVARAEEMMDTVLAAWPARVDGMTVLLPTRLHDLPQGHD